jgi:ribose transport system substrate-binding protein
MIDVRHVLPAILPVVLALSGVLFSSAVLAEATLFFVGLADHSVLGWGHVMAHAGPYLCDAWWMWLFPGLLLIMATAGVALACRRRLIAAGLPRHPRPVSNDGNGRRYPYSHWHGCASMTSHGSKLAMARTPPFARRRAFLAGAVALAAPGRAVAQERRFTIGFANITDDSGARLEGLGFSGEDVRSSFTLGARGLPIDLVLYDNAREAAKTIANAEDAVQRKVDLYIQYSDNPTANDQVAKRLVAAGIPVLAVNFPVGNAPLYAADNREAGRIAGEALGKFALATWPGRVLAAAILGVTKDPAKAVQARIAGITEGLNRHLPNVAPLQLDSGGNFLEAQAQLRRFIAKESGAQILVATLDDATALGAKMAVETVGRVPDTVIVSQGCDPSVHGGASSNKVIHPNNRNSVVLGSVAYFLDRYGRDVLPLAWKMLQGESVPARTFTSHVLATASNVFRIYPPIDMN